MPMVSPARSRGGLIIRRSEGRQTLRRSRIVDAQCRGSLVRCDSSARTRPGDCSCFVRIAQCSHAPLCVYDAGQLVWTVASLWHDCWLDVAHQRDSERASAHHPMRRSFAYRDGRLTGGTRMTLRALAAATAAQPPRRTATTDAHLVCVAWGCQGVDPRTRSNPCRFIALRSKIRPRPMNPSSSARHWHGSPNVPPSACYRRFCRKCPGHHVKRGPGCDHLCAGA